MRSFLLIFLVSILVVCTSCNGSGESSDETRVSKPMLKLYQPEKANFVIRGDFREFDSLRLALSDPTHSAPVQVWRVSAKNFEIPISFLNHHELALLSVLPIGRQGNVMFDLDMMPIPLWAENQADYTLVLRTLDSKASTFNDYFAIQENVSSAQDDFMELYKQQLTALDNFANQIAMSVTLGTKTEGGGGLKLWPVKLAEINDRYVRQGLANAPSLYLIFKNNDHRTHQEQYTKVLASLPSNLKSSRYAVDLHNRLEYISNPPSRFDVNEYLHAVDYQMKPFAVQDYADANKWLLVFWNSNNEAEHAEVLSIQNDFLKSETDKVQLLFFNLDARMSRWRLATSQLDLKNSFFVRAEQRNMLMHDWYLTNTLRIMLIEPDGTLIKDDLNTAELSDIWAR